MRRFEALNVPPAPVVYVYTVEELEVAEVTLLHGDPLPEKLPEKAPIRLSY
jgi:hypothetical protein